MKSSLCVTVLVMCIVLLAAGQIGYGAPAVPVEVGPIRVTPETPSAGQHPKISATITRPRSGPSEPLVVTIIASVMRPDNILKSWTWKKVSLSAGDKKEISIPNEYDIRQLGKYKIQYSVYSADMQRRFAAGAKTFSVVEKGRSVERQTLPDKQAPAPRAEERNYFGIGLYGNTFNPAGGGTLMLWPFKNVGIQGSYTVGTFTSYEARMLVKFDLASGYKPYVGVGYLNVSVEKSVIGVTTEFTDSGISGVIGVEIPLGRRFFGYVEVSGAAIDLEKDVTNGAQTVKATVDYAPATIGIGIVYYLF